MREWMDGWMDGVMSCILLTQHCKSWEKSLSLVGKGCLKQLYPKIEGQDVKGKEEVIKQYNSK
jgi:hypothetical protein